MTDRKAQDVDGCFLSNDHGMRNSHDGNPNKNTSSVPLQDGTGNSGEVILVRQNSTERGGWNGKLEFMMTCIGYAVGLGNVWRFPYLCFKNGGGAFLIPYTLMLALLGLPLFFLEFAFGQFASLGPISVWNISPLFKGIGYAMVFLSWLLNIYYQVIVAHCLYYFGVSFTHTLPWTECNPPWSTPDCIDSNRMNYSNITYPKTPSEDYYFNQVLKLSPGFEEFGAPGWELSLCLLCCWILCGLAVIKGVQSLGKVSYFTSVFPYIMLTILLIRGALLPGSGAGVLYYLTPDFSRLTDPQVWADAATQIFFSLGCCNGGLITVSSYNKFKNNCCRDAVIVAIINCATSVYAGFVIFSNLGFMAYQKNTTISEVASSGPGLAFIVYPEAMTNMPLSSLWSVLFFTMMLTLGFGSQFSILETTLSGIQDEFRRLGVHLTERRKIAFRISVCCLNFFMGLPMVCAGGYYLVTIYDSVMSGYAPLIVALSETVVITYVYGLRQFRCDIELMINERPNWYWRICWLVITPTICLLLIISVLTNRIELKEKNYSFPPWAYVLYQSLSAGTVLLIVGWFIYKYCSEGGFLLLKEFLKPVHEWGPADKQHRAEFISMIKSNESRINEAGGNLYTSPIGGPTTIEGSQLQLGYGLNSSLKSGLAAAGVIDDTKFFQSKLNVAEKLTHAHTKEVVKRVVSNADINPANAAALLSASQTALAAVNSVALLGSQSLSGCITGNINIDTSGIKLPEQFFISSDCDEMNESVKSTDQ
ncbi:unnamed protein product [Schistosoma mattheei]|uniref:Transporter n=3 Tax=Schistosoma mattheei TaxID=31246 RepID=A0AA85B7E8_9TREM|nr:unnamed protein product [Schistosoma mattheei]